MDRSPFAILGTTPDVSLPELKRIYRRLVRQWHPDRFHGDPVRQWEAKERLTLINGAYRDCLALIAERQRHPQRPTPPPVTPPPRRPAATLDPSPRQDPPPVTHPPRWPHAVAALLLLLAWLAAGKRHPDDLLYRTGFFLLFTTLPAAAALWYTLGVIRGRFALFLYAGTTLVFLAALLVSIVIQSGREVATIPIPETGITTPVMIDGRDTEPFPQGEPPPPARLVQPAPPVPPAVPVPAAPAPPTPPSAPAPPPAR